MYTTIEQEEFSKMTDKELLEELSKYTYKVADNGGRLASNSSAQLDFDLECKENLEKEILSRMDKTDFSVFAGATYYARGGYCDFKGSFKTIEKAEELIKKLGDEIEWYQIIDTNNLKVVKANESAYDHEFAKKQLQEEIDEANSNS